MAEGLRLEVREFADLTRWRWVLTDANGRFLADHAVRLDTGCWQFEAFADLSGYVWWHAAPDERYPADEARIVAEVGGWIAAEVLGPRVTDALARGARDGPLTVRVTVPDTLLFRPLELACLDGRPLALHDINFVFAGVSGIVPRASAPRTDRPLRVLGLFSLPEGGQPLNLRHERCSLVELIRRIAATGRGAEVRVLQYGVTRDKLRDVLEDGEGWDVIHVSGHGTPGELLLETASGGEDRVTAGDLADLLYAARQRVKLVTVAACWSAGATAAEQRRLLGLPVERSASAGGSVSAAPKTLATQLSGKLGCAILAMRYPVSDTFTIGLSGKLYELLVEKGQPLPQALGRALRHVTEGKDESRVSALSLAAPTILGELAAGLTLAAPPRRPGEDDYDTQSLTMTGFPPQSERFVGRTGVMARASAALAAESGIPGVLLYGMPGGGKTACALELAYGHEHAFRSLVWFKAPDEGMDISGTLTDFALTLERYLSGFRMVDALANESAFAGFLPRIAKLMETRRLLIVIDNAESLISDTGTWRDANWGQVIGAMTAHTGLGRLILTSRRVPSTGVSGMRAETADALSADEALLLARELPHLRDLVNGDMPGVDRDDSRALALGVLSVAQGHPKLLELANGQAADPDHLAVLVEAGDRAWRAHGGLPDGFFTADASAVTADDYLHVLAVWTRTVTERLSAGERDLFWFLCCLEEPDRSRSLLDWCWDSFWTRLGRDGEPPDIGRAITSIAGRGLIAVVPGTHDEDASYSVHAGIATAGRGLASGSFRDAVDAKAAAYWDAVLRRASGETDGGIDTRLVVRAGLSATPYLVRQERWAAATSMLEHAFVGDPSRATATAVLLVLQRLPLSAPSRTYLVATAQRVLAPAAAEPRMRTMLDDAVARGDYRAASITAGQLTDLYQRNGRLAAALALTDRKAEYTRKAGLGPWTRLANDVQRLQILAAMGDCWHVLAEVKRIQDHFRTRMRDPPPAPGPNETAHPWDVRESLLDTGRFAARRIARWEDALSFNATVIASLRERHAPAEDITGAAFNDYFPLLRLGRTDEAVALLLDCRRSFYDARDTEMLGKTLSALADAENERAHGEAAIQLERDALRYRYLASDVPGVAVSYHNLGRYLRDHARRPAAAFASHLAAALIRGFAGIGGTGPDSADGAACEAACDLRESGAQTVPPLDVADLCRNLGDIPGTDPASLIAWLSPDPETAGRTLRELIARTTEMARQRGTEEPG